MWPIQNCFLLFDKPLLRPLVQPKLPFMPHERCAWKISTTHNIQCGSSVYCKVRDSSIGIANRHGLDCPGIESWCETRFSASVQNGLVPTQPPIQQVPDHSQGKAAGAGRLPPAPQSSAEVTESVRLYLYSTLGPSWSVLGWTLPQFTAPTDDNSSTQISPNFQSRLHSTRHLPVKILLARGCLSIQLVLCCPVKGSPCHSKIFKLRSSSAGKTLFPNTPTSTKQNCIQNFTNNVESISFIIRNDTNHLWL